MNPKATQALIHDTQASYYNYVTKIEAGSQTIVRLFKAGEKESALQSLFALSEGLLWLFEVEQLLATHSYRTNSPISRVQPLFKKIEAALSDEDYALITDILENELQPIFSKASQWKFKYSVS